MSASTVRILVAILGILFLLALYMWERRRSQIHDEGEANGWVEEDPDNYDPLFGDGYFYRTPEGQEPFMHQVDSDEQEPAPVHREPYATQDSVSVIPPDQENEDEYGPEPSFHEAPKPEDVFVDETPFEIEAEREDEEDESERPSRWNLSRLKFWGNPEPETLLIQIAVRAKNGSFSGRRILEIAKSCSMIEMEGNYFGCVDVIDGEEIVYFKMVNLLSPGSFPIADMDTYTTPGVLFFASLQGNPEDTSIFSEMVRAAQSFAKELHGDLLDDGQQLLTNERIEALQQLVGENIAQSGVGNAN